MGLRSGRGRKAGAVLFLCLMAGFISPQAAQSAKKQDKLTFDVPPFTQPQLLNSDTNPTLRYPVASLPGVWCPSTVFGWLDISRDGIRFSVVQPPNKTKEEFEARWAEINEIKTEQATVSFRIGKKKHVISYMDQRNWVHFDTCQELYSGRALGKPGTTSISNAFLNFDKELAQVKAAIPPPAPAVKPVVAEPEVKPVHATPPVLFMIVPSGVVSNQVVDVNESNLTVRGFATDSKGIPVVKINGVSASMRPQSSQAAEFWEPLVLQPGDTRIEVVATNAANLEAKLAFLVRFTPKSAPVAPKGLTKDGIIALLHGEVSSPRIAELVNERGIKFSPTETDLNQIRSEGGTEELLQVIRQAAHP